MYLCKPRVDNHANQTIQVNNVRYTYYSIQRHNIMADAHNYIIYSILKRVDVPLSVCPALM